MLQAIREKTTGWIAYGIIFLISVPFALWGVNSYLGGGEALPAATVNGEEITSRDLDQAYGRYRQRLSQLFGGNIPESFASESQLKQQVLDQMIEESALDQYALRKRYRIAQSDVFRSIRNMEAFQRDGKFDGDIFDAQVRSLGYSTDSFVNQIKRSQATDQLQTGITATAFKVPLSEKHFVSLSNQSRKIRSLTRSIDLASISVDSSEIEAQYESHSNRYQTPELVKIDYIELSLDKVKSTIEVDQVAVLERYENALSTFTSPESREASHILLTLAADSNSEQSEQLFAQISQIRQRIVNGESFSDLAREFSQDPVSAADGGNLGEIESGVMVQAFETALFSLKVGEISGPVKTSFGWHLIQLHGIKGGEVESFESIKSDLENEIKTELAESQIFDLVENLANLAYEQSDSLLPAAEQLELTVETSDWFDHSSGSGIAEEAKVRQAAFSSDVLNQGLNSEAIELGDDRVVFIRLNQHKVAAPKPLSQVEDSIRLELTRSKGHKLNLQAGKQALEALGDGITLDTLAVDWSTAINDLGFVKRRQSDVDAQLLNKAFSMSKPVQGLAYEGLSQSNGDYSVIELSAVISNDVNIDRQAIDQLTSDLASAEYQSVLKMLASRADVVRTPLEDLQ